MRANVQFGTDRSCAKCKSERENFSTFSMLRSRDNFNSIYFDATVFVKLYYIVKMRNQLEKIICFSNSDRKLDYDDSQSLVQ